MVGEISPDIISTISQIFNIPIVTLFISFPLGFVILYSLFYYNKKEWDKIGEIGKTIFSFFIGFSIYFIMKSYLTFLLFPLSWVIFQPELMSQIDNAISFILGAMFLVYLQEFIKNKYKKEKIISGTLKIFTFFSFLISFTLFATSISTFYSSFNFISGLSTAFGFITISFSFVGIFLISFFFKEKQARNVLKIFPTRSIYYLLAIVGIASFTIILNFLLPHISYYNIIESGYLIDGKDLAPVTWNQQFWENYKAIRIPLKIENSGFFGWIPLDYGDMVLNFSIPYLNISFNGTNFFIRNNTFPDDQTTKIFGIKNMTIDETANKALLFFDRYSFLDNKRLEKIYLEGYESIKINESYYKFEYLDPKVDNNSVYLSFKVANNLSKGLDFKDVGLFSYKYSFSECKIQEINGFFTNHSSSFPIPIVGHCEVDICILSFEYEGVYILNENYRGFIKLNIANLNPNSEIEFNISLNCSK